MNDLERRVLAHLPRWRTQKEHAFAEKEMRKGSNLPKNWKLPTALTITELLDVQRKSSLFYDRHSTNDPDEIFQALQVLEKQNLAEQGSDGWAMTKKGFEELQK